MGQLVKIEHKFEPNLMIGAPCNKAHVMDSLARLYSSLRGWENAFSACEDIGAIMETLWYPASDWAAAFELSWDEVKKHVTPDMTFTPSLSW